VFDFYSDRVPRAPMAWRELGLEWLFRLKAEPRRLGRRYLLGNPLFVGLAVGQRLAEGRVRRSARSTPPS
jgi:N-acetylglucosaminyldiphosphoundecaprenol N-acetyl-beta-D-mannosaminyltransferase